MIKLRTVLSSFLIVGLPSLSWATCSYSDGTIAPEPGLSQKARESKDWGPTFMKLFNNLSEGEKSTLVAILQKPGAALLTTKCSNNDLFWTHLSLVGMSEVKPDAIPANLPPAASEKMRAFILTASGHEWLPSFLRSAVRARQ